MLSEKKQKSRTNEEIYNDWKEFIKKRNKRYNESRKKSS